MRRITKRIRVSANLRREVQATGSVIVCRGGGWPTHRLHWEEPSAEPFRDASSEPILNGQVYIGPEHGFSRFWVSCSTVAQGQEDIILDVIDCATPVVDLGRSFGGFEHHVVYATNGSTVRVTAEETATMYADAEWATDLSDGVLDATRRHVMPRGFIGGGVSADQPCQVHLYEKLTYTGTLYRAKIASWNIDEPDASGRYSCSLSFGGLPSFQSTWLSGISSAGAIAWPYLGLVLDVTAGGLDTYFEALLYERLPR